MKAIQFYPYKFYNMCPNDITLNLGIFPALYDTSMDIFDYISEGMWV